MVIIANKKHEPLVFVVVPVYNRLEKTRRFLEKFSAVTYRNYKIVIVDDQSYDGTQEIIPVEFPNVVFLSGNGNLWWSGATNKGVLYGISHGADYVLTINDDATFEHDFLTQLVASAENNRDSIVGSLIKFMQEPHKIWALGGFM